MKKVLKTGLIMLISIIAFYVFSACKEETPMSVTINADQLEIRGKTSCVVHPDTAEIVITRDSLPIDEKNEMYRMRTSIRLILDSLFTTDSLEDTLKLQFTNAEGNALAVLVPSDSTITDSLIVYLKKETGKAIDIAFEGQMDRSSLLQLQKGAKVAFTGFSFPFADPKITAKLDKLGRAVGTLKELYRDLKKSQNSHDAFGNMFAAMFFVKGLENVNAMDREAANMKNRMTPLQLAKYELYHQELQVLNNNSR